MPAHTRTDRWRRVLYATCIALSALGLAHWATRGDPGAPRLPAPVPTAPPGWNLQCVDCPHVFFGIGDQGLRLDSAGAAHIAYVGDAVYYAHEVQGTWQVETVDAAPATIYDGTYQPLAALALDANDTPHLAYLDASDRSVVYAHRTASGWLKQTVASAAAGHQINYETAIAVDRSGAPRVVYAEQGALHYARWTGGEWRSDVVDDTGWSEMYFSLALDANDTPHIGYFCAFGSKAHLKYATAAGSAWVTEFVDRSGFLGEFNSLAVDAGGTPHISYLDYTHGQLKYARRRGRDQWTVSVVDAAQWFGGFTSIALDRAGNPHISYTGGGANEARYAYWTGATWLTRPIEGNVWYTALALDRHDVPQVVYYGWSERDLKSARWSGHEWVKQTVDSAAQVGRHTSLALDGGANPRISYSDYKRNLLKFAEWRDGAWRIQTLDTIGSAGGDTSVALDGAGAPFIGYYDGVGADLKVARRTGDVWRLGTVDAVGDVGRYPSLAVAADGSPRISYYDATNGDLKFARWAGTGWRTDTVDAAGDTGAYTSLALDRDGNARISYYDVANGDLAFARWTGDAWLTERVDAIGDVGLYTSLALDRAGNAHISYYDKTNGDLKYAHWDGTAWRIATVDSADDVGAYSSLALDRRDAPHISYYRNPVGGLRYARWTGSAWATQSITDAWNVGSYTSLALDGSDRPHISYLDADYRSLRYAFGDRTQLAHLHRQVLDADDEVRRPQQRRLGAGELEGGQAADELLEHHAQLQPRQAGAETEVGAVAAEGDVRVGVARDVEAMRSGEDALVAIGGGVEQQHLVAGADALAAQLEVAGRGAVHVLDRRHPAQHLLGRGRHAVRFVDQAAALLGVLQQRVHAAADHVASGLVAADENQQ